MFAGLPYNGCRKWKKGLEKGKKGQNYRVFAAGSESCYEKY